MNGGLHEASARTLTFTWLALMLLAAISLVLRFAHLGTYSFAVALGIAVVKAALVALVFMELASEGASLRIAFATGLVLVAILATFMIADVLTRTIPPLDPPPGNAPRAHG